MPTACIKIPTGGGKTYLATRFIDLANAVYLRRQHGLVLWIHAEDAKAYLLTIPGIGPENIAIKSSQKDELKEIDDTGGLMARNCQIRYIITKQALQEGWDCP